MNAKRGFDPTQQPAEKGPQRALSDSEQQAPLDRPRRSFEPLTDIERSTPTPATRGAGLDPATVATTPTDQSQTARRGRELLFVPPLSVLEDETPTQVLSPAAIEAGKSAAQTDRPRGFFGAAMAMLGIGLLLALLVGLVPSRPRPTPPEIPVLTSVSKVCPDSLDGQGGTLYAVVPSQDAQFADARVALRRLEDTSRKVIEATSELSDTSLVTPVAASSVYAGVLSQRGQQTFWASCRIPSTDQFLHAPTSEGARLHLVNPDDSPAIVDVIVTSDDGEVTVPELRNINLAGRSTMTSNLEDLLSPGTPVGLRVRVTDGRVYSGLRIANPDGGDYSRAVQAGRQVQVPIVPPGSSSIRLLISNPGTTRLTVRLTAFGAAGSYQLPGLEEIIVDPRRTQSFDLSEAIAGDPISLQLSADQEFSASILAGLGADFTIVAGHSDARYLRATDLVSVVPDQGQLLVANTSSQDDTVTIDWGAGQAGVQRPLAAGSLLEIAVPSGARLVRVTGAQSLTGGIVVNNAGGVAVVPLEVGVPSRSAQLIPDPHIG